MPESDVTALIMAGAYERHCDRMENANFAFLLAIIQQILPYCVWSVRANK